MIYSGSTCKINNCNICYNYIHEANEYNCNYCDEYIDELELICNNCKKFEEIYFDCSYCDEICSYDEFGNICNNFIYNINVIKKWYKNIKKNKILWEIAEYYTQKKYKPESKFIINFVNDFESL